LSSRRFTRRSFLRLCGIATPAVLGRLYAPREAAASGLPDGELSLYNTHSDERLEVTYRNASGHYDARAIDALNHILRCHHTGRVAQMDLRVIEFLNLVDKTLGGPNEVHIVSGFRSPEYNRLLIRMGRGVARHSLHTVGKAIDIRVPGVDLGALRRTALDLQWGGVGYYSRSGFVHLDSGGVRFW
jgi:uncharacterized protein YcbK (DUF882 family)